MTQKKDIFFVCIFAFFVYAFFVFSKYYALGYYDWDLAFYSQAARQLIHGDQFVSVNQINFFGAHFSPITFLTLPIFFLFQSATTLLFLKILAFILGGFMLAEYVTRFWKKENAVFVLLLYFLFPANFFGLLYEYSPEAFAPPVLFFMFISLKEKNIANLIISGLLLATIKENMCLVAAMFFIYGAIQAQEKRDKIKLLSFAFIFLIFFSLCALIVIPFFQGFGRYPYAVRYSDLGSNTLEIFLSPFFRPQLFFSKFFSGWNATFTLQLFDVLLVPVLLSPGPLLLAAPLFAQHFLSSHFPEHTIFFFYGPTLVPFIFIAFVETMKKISQKIKNENNIKTVLVFFLSILCVNIFEYKDKLLYRWNISGYKQAAAAWEAIKSIPLDASVVASFRFLAPLAMRSELYPFSMVYDERYQNPSFLKYSELHTHDIFHLPETVQYALVDLQEIEREQNPTVFNRIRCFLKQESWQIEKRNENILLLKRKNLKRIISRGIVKRGVAK